MVQRHNDAGRTIVDVLGAPIDVVDWEMGLDRIVSWAASRQSRYICICNVHSIITAHSESGYRQVLLGSDMNTPDGAPVAWYLRREGFLSQQRINGPDLMWLYMARAAASGESVYFYGGTPATLALLGKVAQSEFPTLKIAGFYSPPFRQLTAEEDEEIVCQINNSGASTVWVSLGCPKQEKWMAAHRGRVNAVMIGVGAAFDYHSGTLRRAPKWMRNAGLEWLHRLANEPRRLFMRYAITNFVFIRLAISREAARGFQR